MKSSLNKDVDRRSITGCNLERARVKTLYFIACLLVFVVCQSEPSAADCQSDITSLQFIAENLRIEYEVIRNYNELNGDNNSTGRIIFKNAATSGVISRGDWEIYFTSVRSYTLLNSSQFQLKHVNGVLFKLVPTVSFVDLGAGQSHEILYQLNAPSVSRTDSMPNWYVAFTNCLNPALARVIQDTTGEDLHFVRPFTKVEQWKRLPDDQYNPYTLQDRYDAVRVDDEGMSAVRWRVVPTPADININANKKIDIARDGWIIEEPSSSTKLTFEAHYLKDALSLTIGSLNFTSLRPTIRLSVGAVDNPVNSNESYLLTIDDQVVSIVGNSAAGVFYGVQTLISLAYIDGTVPVGTIRDWPRFEYRGQMVDVARNFHTGVREIKKIIDAMSTYKMNRLHFHLGDDEGWRLQIPGLPELTQIGGRRCHDPTESLCVITQLGSMPSDTAPGSGWYSTSEYRDILLYAEQRHVKVIPEFDMPGHSHAAIIAMLARYRNTGDTTYLLSDLDDQSEYESVQGFTDNAVNPCVNSTYTFIEHVIQALIELHRGVQDLTIYHFGGDEVPPNAWSKSPACEALNISTSQVKAYFVDRVSEIGQRLGVELASWEDGLYSESAVINKSSLASDVIYTNVWDNVWQWGKGKRAYELANAGYKVIISHATHFYLDFPIEPDPEERGLYWGTRTIPMKRTFSYQPDSVYDNIDYDTLGKKLDKADVCIEFGCPALNQTAKNNVIGIQGQVFSETARLPTQFQSMLFPRLLAVAERSWHIATDWEHPYTSGSEAQRQAALDSDWSKFANSLGYKELRRLDDIGIAYRVPPPGARINGSNELSVTSGFPGLSIRYSFNNEQTWFNYEGNLHLSSGQNVTLYVLSANGQRTSRTFQFSGVSSTTPNKVIITTILLLFYIGRHPA